MTGLDILSILGILGFFLPPMNKHHFPLYRDAAEQGDADAQFNLGLMYGLGLGVLQDTEESYIWFSLSAIAGKKTAVIGRVMVAKLSLKQPDRIESARQKVKRRLAEIDNRNN